MTLNFMFLNQQQDQLGDTALSDSEEEGEEDASNGETEEGSGAVGPRVRYHTMKEYQAYALSPLSHIIILLLNNSKQAHQPCAAALCIKVPYCSV